MSKFEISQEAENEKLSDERKRLQIELAMVYKKEIDLLPELILENYSKGDTVLVIIDMLEGFTNIGNLKSDRIASKSGYIADIASFCLARGIDIIAFADEHGADSPEFKTYGEHCVKGTIECDIVKEIREATKDKLLKIPKNSNNGFIEAKFQEWLVCSKNITNYIVVGDCTDICVSAFAESMRSYFDRENITNGKILIPESAVATYDAPWHNGDFKHYDALINMKEKGIEIFSRIKM